MSSYRLFLTVFGVLIAGFLQLHPGSGARASDDNGAFVVAQALTPEEKAALRKRKQLERKKQKELKRQQAQERKRQRQQQQKAKRQQQQQKAAERRRKQQARQKANQQRRQQAQQRKREQQAKQAAERRRKQQAQQKANQQRRKQKQQEAAERRRKAAERKKQRQAEQAQQRQQAAERRRAEKARKAAERKQRQQQQKANQAERARQAEDAKRKRQAERERKKQEAAERRRNQHNQSAAERKARKEQQKAKQEERRLQAEQRKKQRQEQQKTKQEERRLQAEENKRQRLERQKANQELRQQKAGEAKRKRQAARDAAAKRKAERARARLNAREQRKLRRQEERIKRANARRQRQLEQAASANVASTSRLRNQRERLRQRTQNANRQAQRRERQQRRLQRQRNWEQRQARANRPNRRRDLGFNRRSRVVRRSDDRVILSGIVGAAAGALATALFIQHNDDRRFGWRADDYYVEPLGNGWTRTVVRRPNGSRIITIRDSSGTPVRRTRVNPDGRRVLYFNNQPTWWEDEDLYVDIEPVRVSIPDEDYIVEPSAAPVERIYSAVTAPPVDTLDRTYTLNQVLVNPRLRNYMPRIDLDTITFASGSAEIPVGQIDKLDTIGVAIEKAIKDNPGEVFLIEGHTDAVGTNVSNLELSDKRASSVADALTSYFGIPPENLVTQGYGEQYLKRNTQRSEQANRRVAIRRITPLLSTNDDQITYDENGNEIFNN